MNARYTVPVVLSALLVLARADIIPTGYKRVQHLVEFTNVSVFTNYHFFVYPRDLPRGSLGNTLVPLKGGVADLSALNPLAVGRNNGAYLYAVPKELYSRTGYPLQDWFTNKVAGVLRSPRLVDPIRSLPTSDPRNKITTHYRIEGLPARLDLINLEPSVSPPADGKALKKSEATALLGLAGAAAWLVAARVSRKWRRRTP